MRFSIGFWVLLFLLAEGLNAQSAVLPLYPDGQIPHHRDSDEREVVEHNGIVRISKVQTPTLEVYLPTKANATGQAVVICPGGGYQMLAYDWEGTDIAKWLNSRGIAGIVLKYRLPSSASQESPYQVPLLDAERAMRLTRTHAKEWNINPQQVGVMGFSAGGHLASTLGTHFDYGDPNATDSVERHASRPDFMVLVYPVISFTEHFHRGSMEALLGKNPSAALVEHYSGERQVGYDTPPTFLVHSGDDEAVPVENSLLFYQALRNRGIPAEMHIYPEGGHGFALAIGRGYLQDWTDRLADWLQKQGATNPDLEDWQAMYNGKDLSNWTAHIAGHELDDNYKNTFLATDSMLRVSYTTYDQFEDKYGHLYYHQPMNYYKMRFAYRFQGEQVPGGASWNVRNSGVMFHSQSPASLGRNQFFPVSIELQLLGGLSDGKTRTTANICTPGTYFEIDGQAVKDHCYSSQSKTYDGDRWVEVEATVLGDSLLVHVVEGDTVMRYEHPRFDAHFIAPGSPMNWQSAHVGQPEQFTQRADQRMTGGYIALQAESHAIDFKDLKILNLEGCTDPEAKNYKSYYVKSAPSTCVY